MTVIKICGITNLADAQHAAKCGADALGFNFYERSPRHITPTAAAEIIEQMPKDVSIVGVFVNHTIDEVAMIARTAGLTAVQLHGDEAPAFVTELRQRLAAGCQIVKALRVGPAFDIHNCSGYGADAILLDAYSKSGYGGTGETFDWETASEVGELTDRLYLAGGLSDLNVGEAIRRVRPYAVDACSLLEATPGRKDPQKVERFIEEARKAR